MGPGEELAGEFLKKGGRLKIKARGASMIPSLWDGDLVQVVPAGGRNIVIGDVICYKYKTSPERLFLHRVMGRDGERFVTKGDALAFREVIAPHQVLGKVVAVERQGRIRRLDNAPARWRNRLMVCVSPFLAGPVSLAIRVRRVWKAAFCG